MGDNRDFSFRVSERPDELAIVVAGGIDETSELTPPPARGRRVTIDAEKVTGINSLGVRAWILMMEKLASESGDVVIRNMPSTLVTQASMITTFLGNARVESFMSPWLCMSCDNTLEELHGGTDAVPQNISCPKCGQQMELDWDRAAYLAFRGGR